MKRNISRRGKSRQRTKTFCIVINFTVLLFSRPILSKGDSGDDVLSGADREVIRCVRLSDTCV